MYSSKSKRLKYRHNKCKKANRVDNPGTNIANIEKTNRADNSNISTIDVKEADRIENLNIGIIAKIS